MANKFTIWINDHVDLSGLQKLQKNLKSLQATIKKVFNSKPVKAFNKVVLGTAAAFTASVVEAAKFNIQMARVWTMAGGGINNFKELREEARKLSSEFGRARSEIAAGMYSALSAGIDRTNLEGFMTQAAKVAVADGSDISTAVDGITTVLNAFKVSAKETESVTDDLFKTVAEGKTNFQDLAANLSTVAAQAASSNIPLKEILAHVATLTAQGVPTAQAMTQIRASIIGLNRSLGDGWSANMSYQEALLAVWKQAGKSQTELQKLVGSSEAVQAVLGGVGINALMAADKLDAMNNSAGAAQAAFEKVDQFRHWPTMIETARGTLSKFGEEVDSRLRPYVEAVTEQIREWRDDQGLWDKISQFLDKGEEKLQKIAQWMSNIRSLEDLKLAGVELGQKFTDYVIEKAKDIGAAMAAGMWDGIKEMAKGGLGGLGDSVADFYTMGQHSKMKAGEDPRSMLDIGGLLKDWLGISGNGDTTNVKESVAQGVKQGIQEAQAETSDNSDGRISIDDLLESGPSLDDLQAIVEKMDLTQEEFEKISSYIDESADSAVQTTESVQKSAEAAKKTAEEAKKASDANVDTHAKVQEAMRKQGDAAVATARAAEYAGNAADQAMAIAQQLAARLNTLEFGLATAQSQIESMRS